MTTGERRPLKSRGTQWAKVTAKILAKSGLTPNMISLLSVVMAMLSFACFYHVQESPWLMILGAGFIQLRLLCNLIDGMVAIEYQQSTPTGELYNDVPDRFADIVIILGVGHGLENLAQGAYGSYLYYFQPMTVAWLGSLMAVITAYVRVLGKSMGTKGYFLGPQAKPHRMFVLTLVSLMTAVAEFMSPSGTGHYFLYGGLVIVFVGSIVTAIRRLMAISAELYKK